MHFAAAVSEPERLTTWVEARQELDTGEFAFDRLELCRYDFDGRLMVPTTISTSPLGSTLSS